MQTQGVCVADTIDMQQAVELQKKLFNGICRTIGLTLLPQTWPLQWFLVRQTCAGISAKVKCRSRRTENNYWRTLSRRTKTMAREPTVSERCDERPTSSSGWGTDLDEADHRLRCFLMRKTLRRGPSSAAEARAASQNPHCRVYSAYQRANPESAVLPFKPPARVCIRKTKISNRLNMNYMPICLFFINQRLN